MKKKMLKIIGKISCVVLLFSVLISALVVPSFAFQNTNHTLSNVYWGGIQSYNLCPFNSLYYIYNNGSQRINYSINAPNTINFAGKAGFEGTGYPLYGTTRERFGNNNRGSTYYYSWDTFANSNSGLNTMSGLAYHSAYEKDGKFYDIYPNFNSTDIWTTAGKAGTNLDVVSYVISREPGTNDTVNMDILVTDVLTSAFWSENLCTIQATCIDVASAPVWVWYSFDYVDDGVVKSVDGSTAFTGEENYVNVVYDGVSCHRFSAPVLSKILYHEQVELNRPGLDRESNQPIRWKSVYISTDPYDINSDILQVGVSTPYLRAFNSVYYDKLVNAEDITNYTTGYYSSIVPYQETLYSFLINQPHNSGPDPELDIGSLGYSVGNAVEGVMRAEIFPSVQLWHILLIPFSLGLVFAFIKFFAGG